MERIKCFWLEPTLTIRPWLRRYLPPRKDRLDTCSHPANHGYHNAMFLLPDITDCKFRDEVHGNTTYPNQLDLKDILLRYEPPRTDPRWPTDCPCGRYHFTEDDEWQFFVRNLYRRADTGEIMTLDDAPAGAMFDASYLHDQPGWCGPDGRSIHVVLPNGNKWCIDSRCSNCTRKDDDVHKCWVRHGEPPELTVDKNGNTCAAGAGSILSGDYHGFLRNGFLEQC